MVEIQSVRDAIDVLEEGAAESDTVIFNGDSALTLNLVTSSDEQVYGSEQADTRTASGGQYSVSAHGGDALIGRLAMSRLNGRSRRLNIIFHSKM